jgi:hypothetical protein
MLPTVALGDKKTLSPKTEKDKIMQVASVYCDKSPRPAYYPVNDGGRSDGWRPLSKYLPQRRAPSKIDDDGSDEPSGVKDEPSTSATE